MNALVLIVGGNTGVPDQHCIMVLQNQCVLQYRFATPKPLKTRPAPDRCKTVLLCNRPGVDFPARSSPLFRVLNDSRSVLAVKGSLRRFAPWTAAGRSEGMAVYEGKGGVRAVWRKGELLSV